MRPWGVTFWSPFEASLLPFEEGDKWLTTMNTTEYVLKLHLSENDCIISGLFEARACESP